MQKEKEFDVFCKIAEIFEKDGEVHFDFRKLKGGPYGKGLPASVSWRASGADGTRVRLVWTGAAAV